MTALAIVPTLKIGGSVVAALRAVPFVAKCPGCERHPGRPDARVCDRLGCPIKHFAIADHGDGNIVTEARHHAF